MARQTCWIAVGLQPGFVGLQTIMLPCVKIGLQAIAVRRLLQAPRLTCGANCDRHERSECYAVKLVKVTSEASLIVFTKRFTESAATTIDRRLVTAMGEQSEP